MNICDRLYDTVGPGCMLSMCNVPAVTHEWQTSVRYRESTFLPQVSGRLSHHCYSGDTLIQLLHSPSLGVCFICLFASLSLFLFVSWLTEWGSRRLCCVVFDSSLGAKLSLIRLLGPTVFLKSVSINIIMLCSRHHWIFYCNVLQNITTPPPSKPHRESLTIWQKLFILTERSLWGLFYLWKFLCFCCVFLSCALGKVLGPCLIKWLRVFFFSLGIYYWHFPGIGLGTLYVYVLHLILQSSSQESRVVHRLAA